MTTSISPLHISVSIINYRTAEMTLSCVQSVLAAAASEEHLRVTTIVVDNASGDGSADRIAAWIDANEQSDRVLLVRSATNSGFSGGHNQGINACDSHAVLVLNSDAALRPGFFATITDALRNHPDAGLFVARLEEPDGTPQVSCFRRPSPTSELIRGAGSGPVTRLLQSRIIPLGLDPDPEAIDWVSFACVLLRRSMIDDIGLMDDGYFLYFEDCEYGLRAQRAGYRAVQVPGSRAMHVGGGSGPVTSLQSARKRLPGYYYRSRSRLFYQVYGRPGLLAANLMWYLGRGIAHIRPLTGRPVPPAAEAEARDIWTGFLAPLAASGKPSS